MIVEKKLVVDEWKLPFDGNPDHEVEVLEDHLVYVGRRNEKRKLIVRIKDKFYESHYCINACDPQDEMPWQDDTLVTFTEIHQVEKTIKVKVWERVPERNEESYSYPEDSPRWGSSSVS